jgi:hypothetical protein
MKQHRSTQALVSGMLQVHNLHNLDWLVMKQHRSTQALANGMLQVHNLHNQL